MDDEPAESAQFLRNLGFPLVKVHHSFNHFDFTKAGRRILVIGPMGSGKTEFSARMWRDSLVALRKGDAAASVTSTAGADRRRIFVVRSSLDSARFPDYPEDALAYRGGYERCGSHISPARDSFALESLIAANPGQVVAWLEDDMLVLRAADRPPVVAPVTTLQDTFGFLATTQAYGEGVEPARVSLLLHAPAADWQRHAGELGFLQEHFAAAKVQILPQGSLPWLASQIELAGAVNLLQGDHAQRTAGARDLRRWRLPAALAAALVLLFVGTKLFEIRRLNAAERALDVEIEQTFRAAMPGSLDARDARERMEQRYRALQDNGGQAGLLPALGAYARASAASPDATLQSLSLRDGALDLQGSHLEPLASIEQQVYSALVLGVRDYVDKNGFPGAVIGLSGGIDSALTLAIAVDALGADAVSAVSLPSRYTAGMSNEDAAIEARTPGVDYHLLPIEPAFDAFLHTLEPLFAGLPPDTTEENIQARCRGVLLMALSNKTGRLVLTTSNKSETAVGYSTLYGDMAGGFAPIKDVPKTLVYDLCRHRNGSSPVIPESIISRPPSAELRPGQLDSDSLPDYDELDRILKMYVEDDLGPAEIADRGEDPAVVADVIAKVDRAEYKRRQAPPGLKITTKGFGRDRRMPITNRYRPWTAGNDST